MSILSYTFASLFCACLFLFMFWRRLKEDYSPKLIFDSGFTFLVSTSVGFLLSFAASKYIQASFLFRPSQVWFWGGFIGSIVGLKIINSRFKLKLTETFEASTLGVISCLIVLYFINFLVTKSPPVLIILLFVIFLMALFYFLEGRYRRFAWYKSGRVGFSGLTISGLYFFLRVVLSIFAPQTFSLVGKVDLLPSAVVAFLLFFSLYNLSEAS